MPNGVLSLANATLGVLTSASLVTLTKPWRCGRLP